MRFQLFKFIYEVIIGNLINVISKGTSNWWKALNEELIRSAWSFVAFMGINFVIIAIFIAFSGTLIMSAGLPGIAVVLTAIYCAFTIANLLYCIALAVKKDRYWKSKKIIDNPYRRVMPSTAPSIEEMSDIQASGVMGSIGEQRSAVDGSPLIFDGAGFNIVTRPTQQPNSGRHILERKRVIRSVCIDRGYSEDAINKRFAYLDRFENNAGWLGRIDTEIVDSVEQTNNEINANIPKMVVLNSSIRRMRRNI